MENLKNLVRFNRYKSVESFNNATDITSSTISIVKLDENVMDIYLGRTKITHSDLLKANIELKKLIDSFEIKLKEIDSNVDKSKKMVDSINIKQNSQSQSILDIKNEIKSIHSEDNHIYEILEDIIKKLKNLTEGNEIPSISDIIDIKQNIDNLSKDILNKINSILLELNNLKTKDIVFTNDIYELNEEIKSLHSEDNHIWEIIKGLQSVSKTILSDIKYIKEDNKTINSEIISLKEKIRFLTGVNVDNFETLEGAHRRLTALENSDKLFQTKVDKIDGDIKSIKKDVNNLQSFENTTNEKIESLEEQIENLSIINSDYFNDIENRFKKLSSTDEELQEKTNDLIIIVNAIKNNFVTKEYVDNATTQSTAQVLADAKAYADNLSVNYDAVGTAAGLNAAMDERVKVLEDIDHSAYITEKNLIDSEYLTKSAADLRYAPIGTTGSGENIDLGKYATIEYVKETYAKKSDIPKLVWITDSDLDL